MAAALSANSQSITYDLIDPLGNGQLGVDNVEFYGPVSDQYVVNGCPNVDWIVYFPTDPGYDITSSVETSGNSVTFDWGTLGLPQPVAFGTADAADTEPLPYLGSGGSLTVDVSLDSNGNLAFPVAPEPGTWALAGCGALVLLAFYRRK